MDEFSEKLQTDLTLASEDTSEHDDHDYPEHHDDYDDQEDH